jgi:putative transposase
MPQSFVRNFVHITFSTKHRRHMIDKEIEQELWAYLGGICKNLDSFPMAVGGYSDHVHVLCNLSKKMALMDLMEELKAHSSKWVKTKGYKYHDFYWQNGYGAFSVDHRGIEIVQRYIHNQEEHHRKKTFQEEYLEFLREYEMEYDERYMWD